MIKEMTAFNCPVCGGEFMLSISSKRYVREDGVPVTQHRACMDGDLNRIRVTNVHELACARKYRRHQFTLKPLEDDNG